MRRSEGLDRNPVTLMKVTFNGADETVCSIGELALDRFNSATQFKLWISVQNGSSICMLRDADHAWLMYLSFSGDSGFVTRGDQNKRGNCNYQLANGQVDEYPLSWCIDLERCYKAIAYFFVNDGARYDFIEWQAG
jgi:hypothetical protein